MVCKHGHKKCRMCRMCDKGVCNQASVFEIHLSVDSQKITGSHLQTSKHPLLTVGRSYTKRAVIWHQAFGAETMQYGLLLSKSIIASLESYLTPQEAKCNDQKLICMPRYGSCQMILNALIPVVVVAQSVNCS